MPASHRKTDQERFVTSLLFGTEGVPVSWTNGEVLMSDGTKKGTENLLLNAREALLSSSEAANTVYVPGHSDKDAGIAHPAVVMRSCVNVCLAFATCSMKSVVKRHVCLIVIIGAPMPALSYTHRINFEPY